MDLIFPSNHVFPSTRLEFKTWLNGFEFNFIQTQINPQLASHGGRITLIDLTEDGYAVLQFGGGCNGCSMVDVTLKDGVEKQLVSMFPNELKGARDVTEHQRGEHSYY